MVEKVHYTLYTVHCTLCTIHCTIVYNAYYFVRTEILQY